MAGSDTRPLVELIANLERAAGRGDLPWPLRTLAAKGLDTTREMLEAVQKGDRQLLDDLVNGSIEENGRRRRDGLNQILPYWARGTAVLDALLEDVVVDESVRPASVTVHWERIPVKLRPAAASLASFLVDLYQDRPRGGRPRKSRKSRPGN